MSRDSFRESSVDQLKDTGGVGPIVDWMLRRYCTEQVEEMKGSADEIYFKEVTFSADDIITVEYTTYNTSGDI